MPKSTQSQHTSSTETVHGSGNTNTNTNTNGNARVESHSTTKRPDYSDDNHTQSYTNCGLLASQHGDNGNHNHSGNVNGMPRRSIAEPQQQQQKQEQEQSRPSSVCSSVQEQVLPLEGRSQSEFERLTNATPAPVSQSTPSLRIPSTTALHIPHISGIPQQRQQLDLNSNSNQNWNQNQNQQQQPNNHHQQQQQGSLHHPRRYPQLTQQQIQSALPDLQAGLLPPIAAMALPLLTLAQFNPAVISHLTAAATATAQTIVNSNPTISNPSHYPPPFALLSSFQQTPSIPSTSIASMPASQTTNNPSSATATTPIASASTSASTSPGLTNRPPIPLSSDYDEHSLTEYQRCVRQNIELFEANHDDIEGNAQGRNVPILLGQVGIRCRYCGALPTGRRARGAVYYSHTIDGVYQIAQNMAKVHLCNRCPVIPRDLKQKLSRLREVHKGNRAAGAGKEYWSHVLVESQGVYEDNGVLRFRPVG